MFHTKPEVAHPDMSDMEKVSYARHNETRGYRQFPSLAEIAHPTREIGEEQFEALKEKYPHMVTEGAATAARVAGNYGLSVDDWTGEMPTREWIDQYRPLIAKITTPSGIKFFAGFEPDYD